MAQLFLDSFTSGGGDEPLGSHTPDVGTSWEGFPGGTYSAGIIAAKALSATGKANLCGPTTNENSVSAIFMATPQVSAAEYDVSVRVYSHDWSISNTYNRGFFAAMNALANTGYVVQILPNGHSNPSLTLYRLQSGSRTQLGSAEVTLADGDQITLELRADGKNVLVNGVAVISSGDTALATTGFSGLYFGNAFGLTGHIDRRQEFDDFSITSLESGGTGPVNAEPEVGAIAVVGNNPEARYGALTAIPLAGGASVAGSNPAIHYGAVAILPPAGSVLVANRIGGVTYGPLSVSPVGGALELYAQAPQGIYGPVTIQPPIGAIDLIGIDPDVSAVAVVVPEQGVFLISGQDPQAVLGALAAQPARGALAVGGENPLVSAVLIVVPETGAFIIRGDDPRTAYGPLSVTPVAGRFSVGGENPLLVFGAATVQPAAGILLIHNDPPGVIVGEPVRDIKVAAVITMERYDGVIDALKIRGAVAMRKESAK